MPLQSGKRDLEEDRSDTSLGGLAAVAGMQDGRAPSSTPHLPWIAPDFDGSEAALTGALDHVRSYVSVGGTGYFPPVEVHALRPVVAAGGAGMTPLPPSFQQQAPMSHCDLVNWTCLGRPHANDEGTCVTIRFGPLVPGFQDCQVEMSLVTQIFPTTGVCAISMHSVNSRPIPFWEELLVELHAAFTCTLRDAVEVPGAVSTGFASDAPCESPLKRSRHGIEHISDAAFDVPPSTPLPSAPTSGQAAHLRHPHSLTPRRQV